MDAGTVSRAGEVRIPVRAVELKHLKDTSGNPVVVRCEAVDEVVMAEVFGLPGVVESQAIPDRDDRHVRYLIEIGPTLIHAATALRGEGDVWIRPAFHADEAHAVPGSVPWRFLRFEDKALIVEAIIQCSGYGGAALPTFPARKRAGGKDRARAVATRRGVRKNPARGAA